MPPPNPARKLDDAPLPELLVVLLRQFQRLLASRGIPLTSGDMQALAEAIAARGPLPAPAPLVQQALADLVRESLNLLQERWGLDFAGSLAADVATLGGWQTTADFLEVAGEKSNAELRIAAGSCLLVTMDDLRFVPCLLDVIADDPGLEDVDAAFARRALLHASGLDAAAPDGLERLREWYGGL